MNQLSAFLLAITLPLRKVSVNAWNLATYWSFSAVNKQFRSVLDLANFPSLLPFFTEYSPYFSAAGFTLRSRPQHLFLTIRYSSCKQCDSATSGGAIRERCPLQRAKLRIDLGFA
jgi:hypothetical protein